MWLEVEEVELGNKPFIQLKMKFNCSRGGCCEIKENRYLVKDTMIMDASRRKGNQGIDCLLKER